MIQNPGRATTVLFVSAILVIALACNMPGQPEATPTAAAVIPETGATSTPAPVAVQHTMIPPENLPGTRTNHAGDFDASKTAGNREAAGGDRFTFGQYERPFNADTMDTYFPELDIVDTYTYQDDTWIYATLELKGPDANGQLSGKYGLELDMDVDGKGDWLILAAQPSSTTWTTDGVTVWQDTDKDVGGEAAEYTDEHPLVGDGFENLVFGTGDDADPDVAWVRISPANPNIVELAVKRSILGGSSRYLAGTWAGHDSLDPARFDFNDHMTHEQAGAASRGFEVYYPIKQLSELDNSCRVAVGFQPTGSEPGLCRTLIPSVPDAPGAPSCPNSCPYGQDPYPSCICWPG